MKSLNWLKLFAIITLIFALPAGCNDLPTTGTPVAGTPDGMAELMEIDPSGKIKLTEAQFLQVVERKDRKLVVIDFWAPWCGPCRKLTPILEKIKMKWGDELEVVKVNVDENSAISSHLDISAIPNVRIFSAGVQVGDFVGLMPQDEIEALLRSLK